MKFHRPHLCYRSARFLRPSATFPVPSHSVGVGANLVEASVQVSITTRAAIHSAKVRVKPKLS